MVSKAQTKSRRPKTEKSRSVRAHVGPASNGPLYLQVARALKNGIVNGEYPVGSQLPTEGDLSQRFAVSRHTVREALRRLREDSLVSSRQGVGTVVVPPRDSDSYLHSVNSINDLVTCASDTRFRIESIKMVLADERLAARAGIPGGEEWLKICGFRYAEGAELPFCWTEYYINREFAAVGRLLNRHSGPIFPLIEDMFGQNILEVHQEITAALISPAQVCDFKVDPATAVLEVRDTYKMADDKTAQVTISVLPASRYHHRVTLQRVKS